MAGRVLTRSVRRHEKDGGEPTLPCPVDLEPLVRLPRPVTLAEMKALPEFAGSPLVKQGRLSVVPLTAAQWRALGVPR